MNEARANRYELLTNYCKRNNILHLFLGHHRDDNLETFITRKVSGSDLEGLGSMKIKSVTDKILIIRPLLSFPKNEIINYNYKIKFFLFPFIKCKSDLYKTINKKIFK